MKILIASDLHWPTINGVSTFSRNLAQGLAAHGHEVLVIAPSQDGPAGEEYDFNHRVIRTKAVPFRFYQNFMISLTPSSEVKKIIEDFDPDVIHIQMLLMIGQAAMKHGHKRGIPVVTTNHAIPENLMDNLKALAPIARPIKYMLKAYGLRFHSKADYVTFPTKSAIGMFNVDMKKIKMPFEAVSNGIDLSRFTPSVAPAEIYEKFGLPTDKPIVTYVGRLDAEKHLWVLIKAFANVVKKTDAHLLIIGGGTDQEILKRLVSDLGIVRHVTFAGKVSDEDLVTLHKVGTVFCMPSPAELQSIATLEAMASGVPIVAVDAGALGELCQNERNGFLCDQDNEKQVADGIYKLVSDKKLHDKMSAESLAIAKTHDIQYTLNRFEEIYNYLIELKV